MPYEHLNNEPNLKGDCYVQEHQEISRMMLDGKKKGINRDSWHSKDIRGTR